LFSGTTEHVSLHATLPGVPVPITNAEETAHLLDLLADQKDPELTQAVALALSDDGFRQKLVQGLTAKSDVFRYNCVRVLQELSTGNPDTLYPYWDDLVPLLDSPNAYHRTTAVLLLANLTGADVDRRFVSLLDRYFERLDDEKIVTARHLVKALPAITASYQDLIPTISARLLCVEDTHHAEGRKDLLKGDVVEAFEVLFDHVPDKKSVLAFVEAQLGSSSPRTRKAAKAFLGRHAA